MILPLRLGFAPACARMRDFRRFRGFGEKRSTYKAGCICGYKCYNVARI